MAGGSAPYVVAGRWQGLEGILGGFRQIGDGAGMAGRRMVSAAREAEGEWRKMEGNFSKVFHGLERINATASQFKGVWREGINDVREFSQEYLKLSQAQARFKLLGLSKEDNEKAFEAVRKSVDRIKGTKLEEVTENITDLFGAFNNLDESMEFLDTAGKISFSMQTLFSGKFSPEQTTKNIQEMFKAVEMMGAIVAHGPKDAKGHFTFTEEDKKKADAYLDTVMKIVASFGSRVTPSDIFMFSKTAKAAASGLNERGLINLSSAMFEMGPSQTGTALQTLMQEIRGGVMKQTTMQAWMALGMVDKNKIDFGQHPGIPKHFKVGAIEGSEELKRDPMEFADLVIKRIEERNERIRKGQFNKNDPFGKRIFDTSKTSDLSDAIMQLFPVRTAQGLMNLFMTQRTRILGHTQRTEHAPGIDDSYALALDSPQGKLRQFEAALDNFKAVAGKPVLEAVTNLTKVLGPLMAWFARHETIAEWVGKMYMVGKVVAMVAKSAAVLRMSGFFNLFGSAPTAAAGTTAARQFTSNLVDQFGRPITAATLPQQTSVPTAASRRTGAGAGRSLAMGLIAGVGIGLAAYGIEEAISAHLHSKELQAEAEQAGRELAEIHQKGYLGVDLTGKTAAEQKQAIDEARRANETKAGQLAAKTLNFKQSDTGFFANLFGGGESQIMRALTLASGQSSVKAEKMFEDYMRGRGVPYAYDPTLGPGNVGMTPELHKSVGEQASVDVLRSMPIKTITEFIGALQQGTEELKAAGKGDLVESFREMMGKAFPDFQQQVDAHDAAIKAQIEQLGYDADSLQKHAGAAEAAAARLNATGSAGEGGDKTPPAPKKKRGGLVLHPTRTILGEGGPEWVSPFHETLAALRGGGMGDVSMHAPIHQVFNGDVSREMLQAARREMEYGLRNAGGEIIRAIERKTRDIFMAT